jgi:hypothetical protein
MDETIRQDIRRLLKVFGVNADEAVQAHLARNPHLGQLRLRLVLEDLTDYGDSLPAESLRLEIEGDVQKSDK